MRLVQIECGYPGKCMCCNAKSQTPTIVYRYSEQVVLRLCEDRARKTVDTTSEVLENISKTH